MLLRSDRRNRRLRRSGIRATLPSPVKKIKTPPKSTTVSTTKKSAFQQSNNNTIISTTTTTVVTPATNKKLQPPNKCNHKSLVDVNIKRLSSGNIRQKLSTSTEENACSSSIVTTSEVKSSTTSNRKKLPRIVFEKQRISSRIRKLTEKENIIITKNVTKDGKKEPLIEDGEFFLYKN